MMRSQAFHTVVLVAILASGVATIAYASGNRPLQLTAGVATTIAYVAWGIIYHLLVGDLHRKLVVEYILIGAIAVIILATFAL